MKMQVKPAVIAVTLLILAALALGLPGAARAMQKLFRYLPGVGVINSSDPIRQLANPMVQTRDGVQVTIEQVVLGPERTTVRFSVEGIPSSAYPQHLPGSDPQGFQKPCDKTLYVRLPGGARVERDGYNAISGHVGVPAYQASFTLAPVPAKVDQATLVMPCLLGVELGMAPENWEFDLRFVPGGDDPAGLPVLALQTAVPPAVSDPTPPASQGITLTMDRMVPLPDGDLLYGRLVWDENSPYSAVYPDDYVLTDAQGRRIAAMPTSPDPEWMPAAGSRSVPLAFKIMAPLQNPGPLTLTTNRLYASLPVTGTTFVFDPGQNAEAGQSWIVDKAFSVAGYAVHLNSVVRLSDGYDFIFQPAEGRQCVDLFISGPLATGGECGPDHTRINYAGPPPGGALTVRIANLDLLLNGAWQVTWEPAR